MSDAVRPLAEQFAQIAAFTRPRAIALMGDTGEHLLEKARECAAPYGETLVINGADYKADVHVASNEKMVSEFEKLIKAKKSGAIIINNIHEADDNAIRMAKVLLPLIENRTPLIVFTGPAEQTQDVLFEEQELVKRTKQIIVEEPPAKPQAERRPGFNLKN